MYSDNRGFDKSRLGGAGGASRKSWPSSNPKQVQRNRSMRYTDRDGDAEMSSSSAGSHRNRFNPGYQRRPGGNKGKFGNFGWWKIVVHNADKFDQAHFFQMIDQTTNENIDPKGVKIVKNKLEFWVKNPRAKDAIVKQSGKLTLKDYTVNLFARQGPGPEMELTPDELKEKIQKVLAGRYSDNKLSLVEFNRDKELVGIRAPLYTVSGVIGELITEKCANIIHEIDFSRNQLRHMGGVRPILNAAKVLTRVTLDGNCINGTMDLRALQDSCPDLTHLSLKDNPAKKLLEEAQYIANVRKMFPKLIQLDELPLPEKISFEDEEESVLPASKQFTILLDPLPKQALERFFLKYIEVHDAGKDRRADLVHAYHEKCLFSVATSWRSRGAVKDKFPNKMPLELSRRNRNFKHVTKAELRESRLFVGRTAVLRELNEMEDTKHVSHSLCIDTSTLVDNFVTAVLSGVMDCPGEYRTFARTFVLAPVPETSSYVITNDQLSVVRTDPDISKKIEQAPLAATPAASSSASGVAPHQFTAEQEALIGRVGVATKMNRDACIQLLSAAQGNYEQAIAKFTQMKAVGQIPPSFFQT